MLANRQKPAFRGEFVVFIFFRFFWFLGGKGQTAVLGELVSLIYCDDDRPARHKHMLDDLVLFFLLPLSLYKVESAQTLDYWL